MNYYSEFDPFAAAWLRNLIEDGLIPEGDVDDRDIRDVDPKDLKGYTQCHFFAGIGGWSLALELAGWPTTRSVWTGSPPCQPFSTAGKQLGQEDERHLWPTFFNLIRECQPPTLFGEQVATAIGHGWFDDLRADLEAEGYAAGMVVLPACSVGAFHKRERIFFVGDAQRPRLEGHQRHEHQVDQPGWVKTKPGRSTAEAGIQSTPLGNPEHDGSYGSSLNVGVVPSGVSCKEGEDISRESTGTGATSVCRDIPGCEDGHNFWKSAVGITCLDGKIRAISPEPEIQPLANGVPNHMGLLRGAGNAIVPQVAAEVIRAYMGT